MCVCVCVCACTTLRHGPSLTTSHTCKWENQQHLWEWEPLTSQAAPIWALAAAEEESCVLESTEFGESPHIFNKCQTCLHQIYSAANYIIIDKLDGIEGKISGTHERTR